MKYHETEEGQAVCKQEPMLRFLHDFLCVPGWYLVFGHHSHRAGKRWATPLRAAPHEGFIPHPKEQPAHTGGQLQQTAQGVCWGLSQQRAQFCK